ncbi:MAG: cupin domain-containing protein [Bacteroidales bacterium]|nr:cupin domain-containing protein [Bacteroidales bacterium]
MEKKEFEKGVVSRLSGSIDYSSDSIVSKTVLNKQTGTVTLFAFDKGQGLSEHSAPFDAMVQVIEGVGSIYIDKKLNSVEAGSFIIMPANIPHAVEAKERFKMLLTMIKSE